MRKPPDPIPREYEAALLKPILALFAETKKRIFPILIGNFQARRRHLQKGAAEKLSYTAGTDIFGLNESPAVKRFIAAFTMQIDRSARKARFDAGLLSADDWDVQDAGVYKQILGGWDIETSGTKLCAETVADITANTNLKAEELEQKIREKNYRLQQEGATLREFTKELSAWFTQETAWKARRIAHTESARSHNYGTILGTMGYDEVLGYEWILSNDACPVCKVAGLDAEGEPRQVKKGSPFVIDNRESTPDFYRRILAPPLHPNCRCAVSTVIDIEPTRFTEPDSISSEGKYLRNTAPIDKQPPKIDLGNTQPPPPPKPKPVPPPPKPTPPPPAPKPANPPPAPAKAPISATTAPLPAPVTDGVTVDNLRARVHAALAKFRSDKPTGVKFAGGGAGSDRLKHVSDQYKPLGDAKIAAILEYAEKLLPAGYDEAVNNPLYAANADCTGISQVTNADGSPLRPPGERIGTVRYRDWSEEKRDKLEKVLEQVRKDVFDILALPLRDRMPIKDTTAENTTKNILPATGVVKERADKVVENVFKAVGYREMAESKEDVLRFCVMEDLNIDPGVNGYDDPRAGMTAYRPGAQTTTIAHEIGHAISLNYGRRNNPSYVENSRFENTKYKDRLAETMAKVPTAKLRKIHPLGIGPSSANNYCEFYFHKYSQKTYGPPQGNIQISEVPSVLLQFFYENPVEFVRNMPKELTYATLGLLDGALR